MNLTFDVERLLLPVSVDLQDTLNRVSSESGKWTPMIQSVVFSFRQKSYSPENGGYHPVEARVAQGEGADYSSSDWLSYQSAYLR